MTAPHPISIKHEPEPKPRTRDKVLILGYAPTVDLAPIGDDSFETWGCNTLTFKLPAALAARWFEMHGVDEIKSYSMQHYRELASWDKSCPVYMPRAAREIPASVTYPLQRVLALHPRMACLLTSSIAYEIALAILLGFPEIHIYGVDMADQTEYGRQKAGCQALIMLAEARGQKVVVPSQSLLYDQRMYGYHWAATSAVRSALFERQKKLITARQEHMNQAAKLEGALNEHNQILDIMHQWDDIILNKVRDGEDPGKFLLDDDDPGQSQAPAEGGD